MAKERKRKEDAEEAEALRLEAERIAKEKAEEEGIFARRRDLNSSLLEKLRQAKERAVAAVRGSSAGVFVLA